MPFFLASRLACVFFASCLACATFVACEMLPIRLGGTLVLRRWLGSGRIPSFAVSPAAG